MVVPKGEADRDRIDELRLNDVAELLKLSCVNMREAMRKASSWPSFMSFEEEYFMSLLQFHFSIWLCPFVSWARLTGAMLPVLHPV